MTKNVFPSTRYQGSKQKFVDWIWQCIKDIPFHTVLDAFGGTGSIAYKMKEEEKKSLITTFFHLTISLGKL